MTGSAPSARTRLPNRRPNHMETLYVDGQTFEVCVGFDSNGFPREVFLNGGKAGSQFDTMLADAATTISVALQHGVPVKALAKSVGRAPNSGKAPGSTEQLTASAVPASAIGAALDLVRRLAPRMACVGIKEWNHK